MKSKSLLHNTIMLYILTFSNYLFNFITIPYQTRVLGPVFYGKLNFAAAFTAYFQVLIDFGFILSGTEAVARNREDRVTLSRIYTSITYAKFLLIVISLIIMIPIIIMVPQVKENTNIVLLYFATYCVMAIFPDYLYRGMEDMKTITIRSVLIKMFFTLLVFFFVKSPADYYYIPLLTLAGNSVAILVTVCHVKKSFGVCFVRIRCKDIGDQLKSSSFFFYSRVASTVYSATNTFIMGMIYGTAAPIVGLFSSANKLISTGKQAMTPITDSLYPYMVNHKDFKIVRKVLCIFMPLITIGCIVTGVFARPICILLFGEQFSGAALYVQLLLLTLWCSFPGMLLGFPVMSPLGLSRYVNISNIVGACVQIFLLALCMASKRLNVLTICVATCITEVVTLVYRIGIIVYFVKKGRKRGHDIQNSR